MADVSWLLCCEKFIMKENGLCDAMDLLFELHTKQVPMMGQVGIYIAALIRSEDYKHEAPWEIRIAVISPDGTVHPSTETWPIEFVSQQVLWFKTMTDIYIQDFGYVNIALQAKEGAAWVTKAKYPILIIKD
jgi:hypothetical protein